METIMFFLHEKKDTGENNYQDVFEETLPVE